MGKQIRGEMRSVATVTGEQAPRIQHFNCGSNCFDKQPICYVNIFAAFSPPVTQERNYTK